MDYGGDCKHEPMWVPFSLACTLWLAWVSSQGTLGITSSKRLIDTWCTAPRSWSSKLSQDHVYCVFLVINWSQGHPRLNGTDVPPDAMSKNWQPIWSLTHWVHDIDYFPWVSRGIFIFLFMVAQWACFLPSQQGKVNFLLELPTFPVNTWQRLNVHFFSY